VGVWFDSFEGQSEPAFSRSTHRAAPVDGVGIVRVAVTIKRVVTGIDDEGKSYALAIDELPTEGMAAFWTYEPSSIDDLVAQVSEDEAATTIEPPPGVTRWVRVELPPGRPAGAGQMPGIDENGFHTTRTLDVVNLLSGRLTLLLDRDEVDLSAGDVVVQQATRHAWRNDGPEPAVMIVAMHRPTS
jgi:mannose-6-phosphate isomerase-like protein (cupin superfamily)